MRAGFACPPRQDDVLVEDLERVREQRPEAKHHGQAERHEQQINENGPDHMPSVPTAEDA